MSTEGTLPPKTTVIGGTRIKWDDAGMRTTYANVCNVVASREEIMVLLGTNQAWVNAPEEITVNLSDRVLLNPHAAKRLQHMLAKTIEEYEKAYGPLG
jgi:hypothetical protein